MSISEGPHFCRECGALALHGWQLQAIGEGSCCFQHPKWVEIVVPLCEEHFHYPPEEFTEMLQVLNSYGIAYPLVSVPIQCKRFTHGLR